MPQTREEKLAYGKAWREANHEKMRAYRAAYRSKNLEEHNRKNKEWRANNKERHREMMRAWYEANKQHCYLRDRRNSVLRLYGLTLEQVEAMFNAQGRVCAICRAEEPCGKGWHIDHCHTTGKVRGVLCNHCNLMLGYARDNAETLAAAITYLGAPA